MTSKYFAYDHDRGFETFRTEAEAKKWAKSAIEDYRENALIEWNYEVDSVCWGEIKQFAEHRTVVVDGFGNCDYQLASVNE